MAGISNVLENAISLKVKEEEEEERSKQSGKKTTFMVHFKCIKRNLKAIYEQHHKMYSNTI